ncbi:hypothetical protein RND71_026868 [Anisodus tanguticus]|uniref:O-fucosyltransferase family protein n=1 Tax=Anisodus tanguticus TaxID=243964 RepID=A0AAE1RLN4_9SOLA|nr:hypothetical protein RND71_026868 [Anisodus tanguticus]
MQKKKRLWRRKLVSVRKLVICAVGVIAFLALLSVHVHVPSTDINNFPDKLPKHEFSYQRLSRERSLTEEFAPPHLSKAPVTASKVVSSKGFIILPCAYDLSVNTFPYIEPVNSSVMRCSDKFMHNLFGLSSFELKAVIVALQICDTVAVARIINATLVIPELDKRSLWKDSSKFSDVFDEDHFINSLANDVRIVKTLPKELASATRVVKHFRSWSGVIRAAKSDSRLANNNLPLDVQKLRCRACYQALRFASPIEAMGKLLADRMRSYGPYIALHLRYEKDMLAFSGCTHDLSPEEAEELRAIRESIPWWKVKDIDPVQQRAKGYCPLTPREVAVFLSALGFTLNTPIYIAAGEIYGGDSHMSDLRSRYPLLLNKEKLASDEELEPFRKHASQMAAIDYIVSVESDIFIPSYSGNMARAVEGHRRFLGHRKTISPDRKSLVRLFDKIELGTMKEGPKLSNRVIDIHRARQGSPRKRKGPISGTKGMDRFRSEEVFYVNPLPDCLCQKEFSYTNTSHAIV